MWTKVSDEMGAFHIDYKHYKRFKKLKDYFTSFAQILLRFTPQNFRYAETLDEMCSLRLR
jgi:hypothetical protein